MAQAKPTYLKEAERAPPGTGPANAEVEEEVQQNAVVEFFSVLYEEAFAYQTIKLVKTSDKRLSGMKFAFIGLVLIYVIFNLFLFHGYFLKEIPYVSFRWELAEDQTAYEAFKTEPWQPYCELNQASNIACSNQFEPFQIWKSDTDVDGAFAFTVKMKKWVRNCAYDLPDTPIPPDTITLELR
eukprot:4343256-Pyramimonas_sp.AAC.1